MDPLLAARAQMELSLGFHMIFAALGIGMPLLLLIAEGLYLRTSAPHYLLLARRWGKATALLFAVGAVSGTALSFELGLLWPGFMKFAGSTLGPAFALEGFAFFIEAIFIGLYLYGWDRLSPRAHFLCGVPVALSGLLSGVLVVAANAWMQAPGPLRAVLGRAAGLPPDAVFRSPAWLPMALHSSLACYAAVGFAAAGVYAVALLRGRRDAYHRSALRISLLVGALAAFGQVPTGDLSAKSAARLQPAKLAAMESLLRTTRGAPLLIGGVPDLARGEVRYGLELPRGLSLLAFGDPDAEVAGLDRVPVAERPNVAVCHYAFQLMVASGFALMGLSAWALVDTLRRRRRGQDEGRLLLGALALASPLGFLALEAGWVVTEVGRQPWIIYRVLRTADAVTPVPGVALSLVVFTALYLGLGAVLVSLLSWLARRPLSEEGGAHA